MAAAIVSNPKSAFSYVTSPIPVTDCEKDESNWHLPLHSWDTHVHVFDPIRYPYSPKRAYTPRTATYQSLLAFNGNLTITHTPQNVVLVAPSPYGTDNSLIIDLLKDPRASRGRRSCKMRAIAVFDEKNITDEQLAEWNDLGVRGFRINTEVSVDGIDYDHLRQKINSVTNRVHEYPNWRCQLFVSGESWDYLNDTLRALPVKIIADHQGGMKGTSALSKNVSVTTQPGYKSLISLAKTGKVYIKISGFYRSSKLTTGGYDDLEPLIKAFVKEVPNQLIWGSDWPHTGSGSNRTETTKLFPEAFRNVDDVAILKNIRKWVGESVFWRMTVKTPTEVYD